MSLFVINRYQGDENAVAPAVTNSDDHLSALLKKIEERKKRKSTTDDKEVEYEDPKTSQGSNKKRKKHRKSTSNDNDDGVIDKSQGTNESVQEKISKVHSPNEQDDIVSNKRQENTTETVEPEKKQTAKKRQDFVILGSDSHKKKPKTKRVLPSWLSKPEIISSVLSSGPPLLDFESILDEKIIKILEKNGTKRLFPVQASLLTWILECEKHRKADWWPQDVCVSAPTGSGKTLAYVLPIVQQLQFRLVRKVRCVVVLPVQELAAQVYKVIETYAADTKLRVALLSGAASFAQEQTNLVRTTRNGKLVSRVDIIVTTPARLVDHLQKTLGFSLVSLRFLVIDEADKSTAWLQCLPYPHNCTAPRTVASFPTSTDQPAQKLLFSATLSQDPEKLSRFGLFQPKLFTTVVPKDIDDDVNLDQNDGDFAGRYTSPDELVERAIECEPLYKPLALFQLLTENDGPHRTLVFVNSGVYAHKLSLMMQTLGKEKRITVADISAILAPSKREHVLNEFTKGNIQVLISSDALARGIDIPEVKLVVSYDTPKHINGYIHRSGRTGRAGNAGTAVSLLMPHQVAAFSRMLTSARKKVPEIEKTDLESYADVVEYEKHLDTLKEILNREKAEALESDKSAKRKHRKQAAH